MSNEILFECENIGCNGSTPVFILESATGFEARMGIALFGQTNMDEQGFKDCNNNPFHEKFYDNFVRGFGKTKEMAIANMKKDQTSMADSLWL